MKTGEKIVLFGTGILLILAWLRNAVNSVDMRLTGISVISGDASNNSSTVGLDVLIRNPFPVSVTLNKIVGTLYIMGIPVAKINQQINTKIFANSDTPVRLLTDIFWQGVSSSIRANILTGNIRTLTIQFVGKVTVSGIGVDVEKTLLYDDLL